MFKWICLSVVFFLIALAAAADDYPKLAPYSNIRWTDEDNHAQVFIENTWWGLLAIDEVPIQGIKDFAQREHSDRWQKRMAEDLPQLFIEMGRPLGKTVDLRLADLTTGQVVERRNVPMTEENRNAVRDARVAKKPQRQRVAQATPQSGDHLEPEVALKAIDEFETALETRWSYRHTASGIPKAMAELRQAARQGMTLATLADRMESTIALGIDGHAKVRRHFEQDQGALYLPLLFGVTRDGVIAFRPDRSALLSPAHPFVLAIDGEPLNVWLNAAAKHIAQGSPQLIQRRSLRALRDFNAIRAARGLTHAPTVKIKLASNHGEASEVSVSLTPKKPVYGPWPRTTSKVLDGNLGYLRIPRMNDQAVNDIQSWMPRFRNTDGLIVDVRGNGGGSRRALRALYPYLVSESAAPRVVNVARVRNHADHEPDHLAPWFMYPADSTQWADAERRVIDAFAEDFRPDWPGGENAFGPWCYLVLGPNTQPAAYRYRKPVVVLMDAGCFSATDIFLAGLRGLEQVTLMGTASGGGSARSVVVPLASVPISLQLGSMVSFTADGQLFDGHGIATEIEWFPQAGYFIGATDDVLDQAKAYLRQ